MGDRGQAPRHRELGRFGVLDGRTWSHPALAGPYLLVRNDREAACVVLPTRAPHDLAPDGGGC